LVSVFARDEHERLLGFVEEFRHGAGRHPVVLCAGGLVQLSCQSWLHNLVRNCSF
jgi:hypothetical protein